MSSNVFKAKTLHERSKISDMEAKMMERFTMPTEGPRGANLLAATKNSKANSVKKIGPCMFFP